MSAADSPLTEDEARRAGEQSVAARQYTERRERAIRAPGTTSPIVHFVTMSNGCCNAIQAVASQGGLIRDLTVFAPGGHTDLQGIPYDGAVDEPDPGTWHFPDWCPELGRNAPARQAMAHSERPEDAVTNWTSIVLDLGDRDPALVTGRALGLGRPGVGSSAEFTDAARSATAADPVWITDGDTAVAVIIPAEEYHPPGTCCCKNCPWNGNHGTPEEEHHD